MGGVAAASTQPDPAEFFADSPLGLAVLERVRSITESFASVDLRVSRSQVTFRRKRGFAYLWRPGMYLEHPGAEVVLSIALARHVESARWKQVVEPSPGRWMHHLEIRAVQDIDDEVSGWLREAAVGAG